MIRLFIDIDGVLLFSRPGNGPMGLQMKEHVDEFIIWATKNYDCYWLTGWAPYGFMRMIDTHMLAHLPPQAKTIKAGIFNKFKTEALDPKGGWIWIDDNLLPHDKEFLETNGLVRNYVPVDSEEPSLRHVMGRIIDVEKLLR